MKRTCKARTKSGARCNAAATANGYCFTHSEEHQAQRIAARRLGGKHRRRVRNDTPYPTCDTKTVQGLAVLLDAVMRETWQLEAGVARSRTLAYLAQVQKGILEVSDIEARVAALEGALKLRGDNEQPAKTT
jgi:hypothetical protein